MRIIHYPPLQSSRPATEAAQATAAARVAAAGGEVARSTQLSCGEHTDYGLLTMVNQDDGVTALQVRERSQSSQPSCGCVSRSL
jgi:isopenicillin N synthase-like dioxygenase